jgi:hypothetical protein
MELQEFDGGAEGSDSRYNFPWLMYNPLSLYQPFTFAFYGAFTKERKQTISVLISLRPSVLVEQLGSHWTDFHKI